MSKRAMIVAAAVASLFVAGYALSPFWAARQFKAAALSADVDRLDAAVDFPAVRESLKAQLTVVMTAAMRTAPELKDNPFAGLGAMLVPTIVNNMVDGYVTPDGLAAMVKQGKPGKSGARTTPDPNLTYDYEYRGLDRFAVTVRNETREEGDGLRFVFERRGLFSWKVVRLELPADMLAETKARE